MYVCMCVCVCACIYVYIVYIVTKSADQTTDRFAQCCVHIGDLQWSHTCTHYAGLSFNAIY